MLLPRLRVSAEGQKVASLVKLLGALHAGEGLLGACRVRAPSLLLLSPSSGFGGCRSSSSEWAKKQKLRLQPAAASVHIFVRNLCSIADCNMYYSQTQTHMHFVPVLTAASISNMHRNSLSPCCRALLRNPWWSHSYCAGCLSCHQVTACTTHVAAAARGPRAAKQVVHLLVRMQMVLKQPVCKRAFILLVTAACMQHLTAH